jgi:single-strand DNA-binding protein
MDPSVTYQGNLVADPTQRVTASGATVTRFRIAASARRLDRHTGEWIDADPNFISVTCWRQLGAHAMASLRKGDSVVVHGRLVYREYDDRHNVRRREHEIDAVAIGPDLGRWPVDIRRPAKQPAPDAAGSEPVDKPADTTGALPAAAAAPAEAAA